MEADRNARYLVEIQSLIVGVFKGASGLDPEREVTEIEEGGRSAPAKKLGPYAKGAFTLLDGEADDTALFKWYEQGRDGAVFASSRRSGAIILVNGFGEELMRWRFRAAVVTDWRGPADSPEPGERYEVESIEITHEGLEPVVR